MTGYALSAIWAVGAVILVFRLLRYGKEGIDKFQIAILGIALVYVAIRVGRDLGLPSTWVIYTLTAALVVTLGVGFMLVVKATNPAQSAANIRTGIGLLVIGFGLHLLSRLLIAAANLPVYFTLATLAGTILFIVGAVLLLATLCNRLINR